VTVLIVTFGTSTMLLLSILAASLALLVVEKAFRIFRKWKSADEEEKYELEKQFYLTYAVVYIVFAIRMFAVPLYFWTMQTLVPMIPGAMCLWGVFNTLPVLCWSTLALKFALPVLYFGWLILARINDGCKRNPLIRNLMGLYIALSPVLMADSLVDLMIFSRLTPVQVACCTSAIDVWARPIPPLVLGISSQLVLLVSYLALSTAYAPLCYAALRKPIFEWIVRASSLALIPMFVITVTEVLTPWILNLPLHHCPFCLLYLAPTSIVFFATLWFSMAVPWWTLLTRRLGRADEESLELESRLRRDLWTIAGLSTIVGVALIAIHLIVATT